MYHKAFNNFESKDFVIYFQFKHRDKQQQYVTRQTADPFVYFLIVPAYITMK